MRHINVPVFIPHLGCPNACVFCNQRTISGVREFDVNSVRQTIETALSTVKDDDICEIAFFGGSFTGIDPSLMEGLLKIANEYIQKGRVQSIRCSTRPDYINENILDTLKKYGVKTVELGLQSVSDSVLSLTKRGHTAQDERAASQMIVNKGFDLVGQMMIGLPGSDLKSEIDTARFIVDMGAVGARIYPTVVFHGTELCDMAKEGVYTPITLEDAVKRSAAVARIFIENGVNIIRIGLQASENLSDESTYYMGPNHPAIGELCENEIYLSLMEAQLDKLCLREDARITIYIPVGSMSKVIGQRGKNKKKIIEKYRLKRLSFKEDNTLKPYQINIIQDGDKQCI